MRVAQNRILQFGLFIGLFIVHLSSASAHESAHSTYCHGDVAYTEILDYWHGNGMNLSEDFIDANYTNPPYFNAGLQLYYVEVALHGIVDAASRCDDIEMLLEVAAKLNTMASSTRRTASLPANPTVATWPATDSTPFAPASTLDEAQFIALAAEVINSIVRSPQYAGIDVFPFNIGTRLIINNLATVMFDHINAWVFMDGSITLDKKWKFNSWVGCPDFGDSDLLNDGAKNVSRLFEYLNNYQSGTSPHITLSGGVFVAGSGKPSSAPLHCYVVDDVHLWILTAAIDLVGAYDVGRPGLDLGINANNRSAWVSFFDSALPVVRSRFVTTQVNTGTQLVNGTLFDPGLWIDHSDYDYSSSYAAYLPQDVIPKSNFMYGDISGDGLDDIVIAITSTGNPRGGFRTLCASGIGDIQDRNMRFRPCHAMSSWGAGGWTALGDNDGDGDKEIYQFVDGIGLRVFDYTKRSNTNNTVVDPTINLKKVFSHVPSAADVYAVGDYDGDEIDDIFQYRATGWTSATWEGTRNWRVLCPKPGTASELPVCGSFQSSIGAGVSLSGGRKSVFTGDYDGDGKDDLWIVNSNGVYKWKSRPEINDFGSGVLFSIGYGTGNGYFDVGYYNGDNRADLYQWVQSNSSTGAGYYRVLCATGTTGLTASCSQSETASNGSYFRVGNTNSGTKDGIIRLMSGNRFDGFIWQGSNTSADWILHSEKASNVGQGYDIGHLSRQVFFLKRVYRNGAVTNSGWASSLVQGTKTQLANQYAYQMFNKEYCDIGAGETCAPAISSFWNGTNGWYRVNYNNSGDSSQDCPLVFKYCSIGKGPYDFNGGENMAVAGRYGLLAEVRSDVRRITQMKEKLDREFAFNQNVIPSGTRDYWEKYWYGFGYTDGWVNGTDKDVRIVRSYLTYERERLFVQYLLPALVNVYSY